MFHVELRQSPHNVNRFNLDQAGLWALLEPWVREQAVELGERRWSPQLATITVLEGAEIPLSQLKMGRGWRAAERGSQDVTEHVLAQARAAVAGRTPQTPAGAGTEASPDDAADAARRPPPSGAPDAGGLAAGVQLGALLGPDAVHLLAAWGSVAARAPGLVPSESLGLAERELAGGDGPGPSGGEGGG